jgi:DNA-binding transcriptional MerR regulator
MDKKEYRTGDVSKMLGIHDNTVRTYADRYSDRLSKHATAAKRKYTHDDVLVLATVAELRDTGISFEAIQGILDNGQLVESVPELTIINPISDVIMRHGFEQG